MLMQKYSANFLTQQIWASFDFLAANLYPVKKFQNHFVYPRYLVTELTKGHDNTNFFPRHVEVDDDSCHSRIIQYLNHLNLQTQLNSI